jgi:spermidine/putrescine transport system substrate-binding protein
MAVLRGAASPVAAHAFINFLLDPDVALENSSYEGYQPPQKTIDAQRVVDEGVLPNSLRNVIVEQSDFDTGDQILELSPVADQMWQEAYQRVVAGV